MPTIRSSIGAVDAYGNVHAKNFPDMAGASHLQHDSLYPFSRESQRFRLVGVRILWWDIPSLDDYFAVDDYYVALGLRNLKHYTMFDNSHPIDPRKLQETHMTHSKKTHTIRESAPASQEAWIKANKQRFKDEYGDEEGERILYATAQKRDKQNESSADGGGQTYHEATLREDRYVAEPGNDRTWVVRDTKTGTVVKTLPSRSLAIQWRDRHNVYGAAWNFSAMPTLKPIPFLDESVDATHLTLQINVSECYNDPHVILTTKDGETIKLNLQQAYALKAALR